MQWIEIPIGKGNPKAPPLTGRVAECPTCHRREWWVFQLPPDPTLYMQCLFCDSIEAPAGVPGQQLGNYVLAFAQGDDVLHPLSQPGREVTT